MDLYSYFSCADFAVCAKLLALSISLQTKNYSWKTGVSYIEVTAGGEVLRKVQNFMTWEVIFPQHQGNADSHTSSALVRAVVNQQPVWNSNFTHQIIGVSVTPLPSASPESKLHSHHTWQGTQPTAAHSHHSHLHDVPISSTRAGTFHLPNFTTNFLNHLLL